MKRTLFSSEIIILLIAAVVLGWLSARKIKEVRAEAAIAATEESKIMLQDAINVYRYDHEGRCPDNLRELIPSYLEKIPPVYKRLSEPDESIKYGLPETHLDGKGGWVFVNDKSHNNYCEVFVNL